MKPNEKEWMCKTKRLLVKCNKRDSWFKMGLKTEMRSKHIEVSKEKTLHFFVTFKYINFNWVVVGDNTYNKVII